MQIIINRNARDRRERSEIEIGISIDLISKIVRSEKSDFLPQNKI